MSELLVSILKGSVGVQGLVVGCGVEKGREDGNGGRREDGGRGYEGDTHGLESGAKATLNPEKTPSICGGKCQLVISP